MDIIVNIYWSSF